MKSSFQTVLAIPRLCRLCHPKNPSRIEPSNIITEDTSTAITEESVPEWKIGRQEALIMISLIVVSLIAALDATVLVPVLPVSKLKYPWI